MGNFLDLLLGSLGLLLFFIAHVAGLIMIPLGLPGTFVQVLAAALLALASGGQRFGWAWVAGFLALALIGEAAEFVSGQWGAKRFGGSKKAAWGALIGGIVGAIVGGIPIPIIGSVIASFIGTFAGALSGEVLHQRELSPNLRVGAGALIGRAIGVGVKLALALLMLILSVVIVIRA